MLGLGVVLPDPSLFSDTTAVCHNDGRKYEQLVVSPCMMGCIDAWRLRLYWVCFPMRILTLLSRSLRVRSSGELLIYMAFSMLTFTFWGFLIPIFFFLSTALVPNLEKKDRLVLIDG